MYTSNPRKSRLDLFAIEEDAASISAQRNRDLAALTPTSEEASQVLCLWWKHRAVGLTKLGPFPLHCVRGECCVADQSYWEDDPPQPPI